MKKKWWHDKVAYQIYPRSFNDTNGDGEGDLRGIIEKLDYLKDLGIDMVWISPVYCSPMCDNGYDISDYYNIDPRFGTMEDMDELLAEAKKRDMYIIMDLVINHCSDEHQWFKEMVKDPYGKYGSYFYLEEGKNGNPPTNLRSYFGGSAWDKVPGTDNLYYLHMFAKGQPDLNWENPEVKQELFKMVNWWLDKGVAGFRIDAIINIQKDLPFHDYPADGPDGLASVIQMVESAEGVNEKLEELKHATFEKHDAFTVGEVFNLKTDELQAFIGENGHFSSQFDFSAHVAGMAEEGWYAETPLAPDVRRDVILNAQKQTENIGFLSTILENHDEPRAVSYYIPDEDYSFYSVTCFAAQTLALRGLPFLFQGQEIGMRNCRMESIDEYDDINTKDQYQVALNAGLSPEEALDKMYRKSRDNGRTMMQWDNSKNAGFSTGTPWFKVNPDYKEINVADQLDREDSVLSHYKKLIHLRKAPAYKNLFVYGKTEPILTDYETVFAFHRTLAETPAAISDTALSDAPETSSGNSSQAAEKITVLCNFSKDPVTVDFTFPENGKLLYNNYDRLSHQGSSLTLEGYQAVIFC